MIFSTPEREFLRLAAIANPNWLEMRALLDEQFDWPVLRITALLHQLDGVIAWRLLDHRMDDLVPDALREDCQQHLEWLAEYNRTYWEQVCAFCSLLEDMGVEYTTRGGPVEYTPLGMGYAWPRAWGTGADIDVEVRVTSYERLWEIIRASKATEVTFQEPGPWVALFLPGGTFIDLLTGMPRRLDGMQLSWRTWNEPPVVVPVQGADMPIKEPVRFVLGCATEAWGTATKGASRLSLWRLARIANWIKQPGWSWQKFQRLLDEQVAEEDRVVSESSDPDYCYLEDWSRDVMKALEITDRLYSILPPDLPLTSLMDATRWRDRPFAVTVASLPYSSTVQEGEAFASDGAHEAYEWVNYPGDESFLFDYQFIGQGIAPRLRTGIWRKREPSQPIVLNYTVRKEVLPGGGNV